MASYSAFFSSGLAANAYPPNSPIVPGEIHMDDVCSEGHRSSTPSSTSSSNANIPMAQDTTNIHRPTLRKRRSSLTLGTMPMAAIKSPVRHAGTALQRHMSNLSIASAPTAGGNRSRSGSSSGIKGPMAHGSTDSKSRMRSGSVGTALRPRGKSIRRAALPPPSVPLPPVPALPVPTSAPPSQPIFDINISSSQGGGPMTPQRGSHARGYSIENGYHICEESP